MQGEAAGSGSRLLGRPQPGAHQRQSSEAQFRSARLRDPSEAVQGPCLLVPILPQDLVHLHPWIWKGREGKGKGHIAVPAYEGSRAKAKSCLEPIPGFASQGIAWVHLAALLHKGTAETALSAHDATDCCSVRVIGGTALRCRLMLEEKQIPYIVEKINMRCYGPKPPEFMAKGTPPVCFSLLLLPASACLRVFRLQPGPAETTDFKCCEPCFNISHLVIKVRNLVACCDAMAGSQNPTLKFDPSSPRETQQTRKQHTDVFSHMIFRPGDEQTRPGAHGPAACDGKTAFP
eukprot:scaffold131530_cov26-Tisochrysis_lutea.AAC.1